MHTAKRTCILQPCCLETSNGGSRRAHVHRHTLLWSQPKKWQVKLGGSQPAEIWSTGVPSRPPPLMYSLHRSITPLRSVSLA